MKTAFAMEENVLTPRLLRMLGWMSAILLALYVKSFLSW